MAKIWEKLANVLTGIGFVLFTVSCFVLVFGTGVASIVGGLLLGTISAILIFAAIMADKEAYQSVNEDKEDPHI